MSQQFKTMTEQEKQHWLSLHGKQPYKMQGHTFSLLKSAGKQVCQRCGLVALRNKATDWCIEKGCNYEDHNQYDSAMKRLTRRNF